MCCIYTYICIQILRLCIYVCFYVCVSHTCMYVYEYICLHVCITYMFMNVSMCLHVYHIYECMSINKYMCLCVFLHLGSLQQASMWLFIFSIQVSLFSPLLHLSFSTITQINHPFHHFFLFIAHLLNSRYLHCKTDITCPILQMGTKNK